MDEPEKTADERFADPSDHGARIVDTRRYHSSTLMMSDSDFSLIDAR
jgi:hypothetical protein